MAEEEKVEEKAAEAPVEEAPKPESEFGDDLMDLFGAESDVVDETLAMLTASLDEIDITDLMEQVRDIQQIMDQRRG
ncbi:MAG: hypothetical protein O2826_10595 [Chloroflexi bacterium]|nr:hypothetical protein [Chloroflexota bacterium]MDA1174952.1 hypothetical protein [Chloroflexota bacterium]